jgi:multiple sugar transport system permease protein
MKHKIKKSKMDLINNIIITCFAVIGLFPLYWLITSSFKYSHVINTLIPEWFPKLPTVKNYVNLFGNPNVLRWLFNSIFISAVTTFLIVLTSVLGAYAFARLDFIGKKVLFMIFIATLMLPKEVYIIPLYQTTLNMGISGGYTGAILPNVALSFGIFLLRQHFEAVPGALREAAKIDGASELYIFGKIYLPLVKAGVAALVILMFIQVWNDYLWQLIQLTKDELKTIQLGVASTQNEQNPDSGLTMAGAVYAALPLFIMFLSFQKYFTQGVTFGAVKE